MASQINCLVSVPHEHKKGILGILSKNKKKLPENVHVKGETWKHRNTKYHRCP